ncbi:hypothetical protein LG198_12415 [Methylobacillus arboreus]|uniref:hypothetical protein n=1 Tax=Methylobacillus arboreus TaxID=755170 RepID=UPI001E38ED7E|nr:hypothetical protein [Methylobacillus arboreus]MCB5191532.1 hypothetical protein [Methylobacillus arboreus]
MRVRHILPARRPARRVPDLVARQSNPLIANNMAIISHGLWSGERAVNCANSNPAITSVALNSDNVTGG